MDVATGFCIISGNLHTRNNFYAFSFAVINRSLNSGHGIMVGNRNEVKPRICGIINKKFR